MSGSVIGGILGIETVSAAETERMMKLQDVILKAMAKKITWMAAAEIAGIRDRTMRRIKQRYEEFGYTGLFDQRRGKRSIHRVPLKIAEQALALYQEKYFDFSVLHFHAKLVKEHAMKLSYSWVKQALQGAGWWRGGRSVVRTADGGRGGRCRAYCCTLTEASTDGSRTTGITT